MTNKYHLASVQLFNLQVVPQVKRILGCACRRPDDEGEPSGYTCPVCRWVQDTQAIAVMVEQKITGGEAGATA
jgi:hypothetical protein